MVNTKAFNAVTYLPIRKASEMLKKPLDELQAFVEKTPFQLALDSGMKKECLKLVKHTQKE